MLSAVRMSKARAVCCVHGIQGAVVEFAPQRVKAPQQCPAVLQTRQGHSAAQVGEGFWTETEGRMRGAGIQRLLNRQGTTEADVSRQPTRRRRAEAAHQRTEGGPRRSSGEGGKHFVVDVIGEAARTPRSTLRCCAICACRGMSSHISNPARWWRLACIRRDIRQAPRA